LEIHHSHSAVLLAQFRKAKADKRIKAIILDVDASETGWAKAEEIRGRDRRLSRFR
jgi:hypothetical protein